MPPYKEYLSNPLNLVKTEREISNYWNTEDVFNRSMADRNKNNAFVLFEGPPSISKDPGINNVLARSIKDTICRYQTLKGKYVFRKAGWDTHDQVKIALTDISQIGLNDDSYIDYIDQRMNIVLMNYL